MPILPGWFVNFLLDYNLHRLIRVLPKQLTLFVVDFSVMFAKKDLSGFQFEDNTLHEYLRHIYLTGEITRITCINRLY